MPAFRPPFAALPLLLLCTPAGAAVADWVTVPIADTETAPPGHAPAADPTRAKLHASLRAIADAAARGTPEQALSALPADLRTSDRVLVQIGLDATLTSAQREAALARVSAELRNDLDGAEQRARRAAGATRHPPRSRRAERAACGRLLTSSDAGPPPQTRHMSDTSSSDKPHVVASSTVTIESSDLPRLMRSGRTRVLVLPE